MIMPSEFTWVSTIPILLSRELSNVQCTMRTKNSETTVAHSAVKGLTLVYTGSVQCTEEEGGGHNGIEKVLACQ